MTHLNKLLLSAVTAMTLCITAAADTPTPEASQPQAQPIINLSIEKVDKAHGALAEPLNLDTSALNISASTESGSFEGVEYSDNPDLDYDVTDKAFIGIATVNETGPNYGQKGGFPEGVYVEPYNSVAGGGIKTKF